MFSIPQMTPEKWKAVLALGNSCLSAELNAVLAKHREVIWAWAQGKMIEFARTSSPNHWCTARSDIMTFHLEFLYRVEPTVIVSAELTVKQADELYRVLEENTFNTEGGKAARNSVMSSIETELKKIGH